jgi:hypothetical protein
MSSGYTLSAEGLNFFSAKIIPRSLPLTVFAMKYNLPAYPYPASSYEAFSDGSNLSILPLASPYARSPRPTPIRTSSF